MTESHAWLLNTTMQWDTNSPPPLPVTVSGCGSFATLSQASPPREAGITEKDKVEKWFIEPLMRMKQDEGFVCLMVCLPLIEAIIRYEEAIPESVPFAGHSGAMHRFAELMRIPEDNSQELWDALRNGLLHSAMVKDSLDYVLRGERPGRPAEVVNGLTTIYIWDLRDAVINLLRTHRAKPWKSSRSPLAKVVILG